MSCVMVHLGNSGENGMEALVVDRLRVVLAQDVSMYSNLQCQMLVLSVEMLQKKLVKWFTASCNISFIRADKLRESSSETFPNVLPLKEMLHKAPLITSSTGSCWWHAPDEETEALVVYGMAR